MNYDGMKGQGNSWVIRKVNRAIGERHPSFVV
jgi:hypothetical protein